MTTSNNSRPAQRPTTIGQQQASFPAGGFSPSVAFQQVKQTQASLARLTRVHHQQNQLSASNSSQTNQSSQHPHQQVTPAAQSNKAETPQPKSTTFVDCLIRRFKDCFSEDFCTVPMFVVGNLSPGSDGTHLILPPCVSLGGQNISRFASPKNLRHLISMRESCRSIEELDLGGNKLNDLIEVYKILQCTPNLKFLNLSENDLSRTAPVAMATTCLQSSSISPNGPVGISSNWPQTLQRTCLAPINQNAASQTMATRRHSTLGSSCSAATSSLQRNRPAGSRVAEARRLATAASAVAQSKKTPPLVASKLANSVAAGSGTQSGELSMNKSTAQRLHGSASSSTMRLARSLSSLSAKDVRAATSRSAAHRSSSRKEATLGSNLRNTRQQAMQQQRSTIVAQARTLQSSTSQITGPSSKLQVGAPTSRAVGESSKSKLGCDRKIFAEPIVESDADVDMAGDSNQTSGTVKTSPQQTGINSGAATATTLHQKQSVGPLIAFTATTSSQLFANQSSYQPNGGGNTSYRRTFGSIKALALNNTGCQWRVVCSILSRMPNLEELHLSLNNYEKIDLDVNEFKHHTLKRLYLCNNPKLTNWQELDKLLIAFPSLEALSIADCNISQIPDNLASSREWRRICGLNINGWPIKEWPVIERLNQLPSLIDLKCRNLDILNTIDEPRQHLIARLPNLRRLNGSEIEEREHAEKAFLRFFMANSHLERPTRFHELYQIHGEVTTVDVDVDLSPPSQARVKVVYLNRSHYKDENGDDDILMSEDFLVKLMDNIAPGSDTGMEPAANMSDASQQADDEQVVRLFKDESQEVIAIEIDLRQSVKKFKSTLANLFGMNSQNLILYYIDHEMVGLMGPELIKHNQKKLWNYNVQDGDQFIVEDR